MPHHASPPQIEILTALCNLPTAPYCEQHVIAWLLDWARQHPTITVRRDRAGNVYLHYAHGKKSAAPLVIEAHMDHPGFVVRKQGRNGIVTADFRGGVRPAHFAGARAKFWINEPVAAGSIEPVAARGRWVAAKVQSVKKRDKAPFLEVTLTGVKAKLPPGTLGMWDLPDVAIQGDLLCARVCDDLGGVAAIVCLFEELIARKVPGHVIGLCSRAEEVGFAGVLAACENGWVPRKSPVIGLETSKALPNAPQGEGPIIRIGDKTGLFSPGLSHFITQSAGHLADDSPANAPFLYQRKLMDGGTCNSTAFLAYGYDSAAMCVALGNYHNTTLKGIAGWGDGAKAGPHIGSETIHLRDFAGMVRILAKTVERIGAYQPGFGFMRERLSKLHRQQQVGLLYATGSEGVRKSKSYKE
jgi:endoglucanase